VRSVALVLLLSLAEACFGQDATTTSEGVRIDLKGSQIPVANAVSIEGTPYYNTSWSRGTLTLFNKKKYQGVSVKLNLQTDDVLYIDEETKKELIALKGSVWEVEVGDPEKNGLLVRFRCGYPVIGNNDVKTYYQVLEKGKATLLKQLKKTVNEEKPFNSATVIRRYETEKSYFLFTGNSMLPLKRKKEDLLNVLADQNEKVDEFIRINKLNLKSDDHLAKIIQYYNTL
jgi:hypothetical protein